MIRRRYHNGKKVKPLNAGFCKFWQHHQDWLEYLPSLEHAEWLGLCRQIMPAVRTHSVFLPGSEHTEWLGLCRQTMPAVRTHSVFLLPGFGLTEWLRLCRQTMPAVRNHSAFFITLFWAYGMTQAMPADNAGSGNHSVFYYPVLGLRNDSGYAGGQNRRSVIILFLINIEITLGFFTYGSASDAHNH